MNGPEILATLAREMILNNVAPKVVADLRSAFGKIAQFEVDGDEDGKPTGWAAISTVGAAAAARYGSSRAGTKHSWPNGESDQPSGDHAAADRAVSLIVLEYEDEQERAHRQAAIRARKLWLELPAAIEHEYLTDKNIVVEGLRVKGKALVIPLRDVHGTICSLQYIRKIGDDSWRESVIKDGRTTGCAFQFGELLSPTIYIAVGLANAASVFAATGMLTFAATCASAMPQLAREVRAKYPICDLILAPNDDVGIERREGRNPGIDAATAAASLCNGRVVLPRSKGQRNLSNFGFNDLHRQHGLTAVAAAVQRPTVATPAGCTPIKAWSVDTFLKKKHKKRRWLVKGLIPERSSTMIHGAPGLGKTHLAVAIGLHLAAGKDFLGFHVLEPVGVMIIDGELTDSELAERLETAAAGVGKTKAVCRVISPDSQPDGMLLLSDANDLRSLYSQLGGIELVIVDSITTLFDMSHGENDSRSWEAVLRFLKEMKASGRSVIVLHHDTKQGEARGHSSSMTRLDLSLHLTPSKAGNVPPGVLKFMLSVGKHRFLCDFPPHEVTKSIHDGKDVWAKQVSKQSKGKVGIDPEKLKKLLDEGLSHDAIAERLETSPSTIGRKIKELKSRD